MISDAEINAMTAGPDGNVWFTQAPSRPAGAGGGWIGWITPGGTITTLRSPRVVSYSDGSLIAGPDGNIWVAPAKGARLLRVTVKSAGPVRVHPRHPPLAMIGCDSSATSRIVR